MSSLALLYIEAVVVLDSRRALRAVSGARRRFRARGGGLAMSAAAQVLDAIACSRLPGSVGLDDHADATRPRVVAVVEQPS